VREGKREYVAYSNGDGVEKEKRGKKKETGSEVEREERARRSLLYQQTIVRAPFHTLHCHFAIDISTHFCRVARLFRITSSNLRFVPLRDRLMCRHGTFMMKSYM